MRHGPDRIGCVYELFCVFYCIRNANSVVLGMFYVLIGSHNCHRTYAFILGSELFHYYIVDRSVTASCEGPKFSQRQKMREQALGVCLVVCLSQSISLSVIYSIS